MSDIVFYVLDESIKIPTEKVSYNTFRKTFFLYAQKAERIFMEEYNAKLSSSTAFWNMVSDIADKCLNPVLEYCMQFLMERKIYTIDDETFLKKYQSKYDFWNYAVDEIAEQIDEISGEYQNGKDYRRSLRENRSRWVGGGFGVAGAIKGAATAGAMNMVSGAGYVLADGVVSFFSSISASSKKEKVFMSIETYHKLLSGMWFTILNMHLAVIDCLENEKDIIIKGKVTEEEEQKASAMLKNLKYMKTESDIKKLLVDILLINPYMNDWYSIVLDKFGDAGENITDIAQYFGIEIDIVKRKLLKERCLELSYKNREESLEAYQKLRDIREKINCNDELDESEKIVNAYRKNFTVDGILYDNVEAVKNAEKELKEIQNIIAETNMTDIVSLVKTIRKLSSMKGALAQKYVKELSDKKEKLFEVWYDGGKRKIRLNSIKEVKKVQEIIDTFERDYRKADLTYIGTDYKIYVLNELEKMVSDSIQEFVQYYKTKINEELENLDERIEKEVEYAKMYYSYLNENTKDRLVCIGIDIEVSDKKKKIVLGAKQVYKKYGLSDDEKILAVYDNTVTGNGKKGFMITNRGFYGTGSFTNNGGFFVSKEHIKWNEVKISGADLKISNFKTDIVQTGWLERDHFLDFVKKYLDVMSVIPVRSIQRTRSESKQITNAGQQETKQETNIEYKNEKTPYIICCKCGNQVAIGKKFCNKCGNSMFDVSSNNVQIATLLKCPCCGNEIKKGKSFCNKCGTKVKE